MASRFEQWRSGWRVALRMARRDVRRHRGRSVLILLMIGLPLLLISAGATFAFTSQLDDREQAPYLFGSGEAIVMGPVAESPIEQEPLGRGWGTLDEALPASPIPGFDTDPAGAIGRLTGGTATLLSDGRVRVESDGKQREVTALGIQLTPHADLGERAHLVSGRWPADDTEVVVTNWGAAQGLPTSGSLAVDPTGSRDGELTERTVVGVAEAATGNPYGGGIRKAAIVLTPWQERSTAGPLTGLPTAWLITDRAPMTWQQVQDLNEHGLIAVSRALWSLPPDELPNSERFGAYGADNSGLAIAIAGAAAGLLFTTALLAGPAFAVSASRQRRTLALSAANGASRAQVRRTILAQAVVLGGLATVGGIALAVGLFEALKPWLARVADERLAFPTDVPWAFLAAIAAAAMASAVVAALLPARALGRLDIVRALRGQEVARPVRWRTTVIGLVLLGVGAVLTLTQVDVSDGRQQAGFGLIGGSAALTIGALCVVPGLLVATARLGSRMPLSARIAARDSSRQRARTAPTVAAVMAGAALLSATLVALNSDTAEMAHTYVPSVAEGTGTTYDIGVDPALVSRVIAAAAPEVVVVRAGTLANAVSDDPNPMPWATGPGRLVQAQRTGCTFEQSRPTESSFPDEQCWSIGSEGIMGGGAVRTAPTVGLAALLHLGDAQRQAVARGAVVLPDRTTIPKTPRVGTFDSLRPATVDVVDGQVRFWVVDGDSDRGGQFTPSTSPTTVSLPALILPWDQFALGQATQMGGYSGYLADETADRLGWAHQDAFLQFVDPAGPIDRATQDRMTAAVQAVSDTGSIEVERGFERDDTVAILILMGIIGAIILVATFVSTALSMAEQLPLMGTLAAVGATRMTRRKLAAAQAFHLAGLSAAIGAAIGLLPGIAAARTVTTGYAPSYGGFTDQAAEVIGPFVVVPWLQILAPVVVIPIIAAVFALVSIRRAPTVARRAT